MKAKIRGLRRGFVVVAVALAVTLALVGTAHAQQLPPPPGTDVYLGPCDLLTCDIYASRSYTKQVLAPAAGPGATGYTAAMTLMCGALGGGVATAAVCGTGFGTLASFSAAAIGQAKENNQCAVLRSENVAYVASWFVTDNGEYCID